MSRLRPSRLLGIALLGLATLSMGTRPTLNAQQAPAVASAAFVGGAFGGGAAATDDGPKPEIVYVPEKPMSLEATRLWLKLQERIPMEFAVETPLEDVLKYIQSKTIDPANLPDGVPIYVDPVGLQDADKTASSTVTINLKGIPLATTLKLALSQLNLVYRIHPDGLLYITSTGSEEAQPGGEARILNDLNRLEVAIWSLRQELRGLPGVKTGSEAPPAGSTQGQAGNMKGGFR